MREPEIHIIEREVQRFSCRHAVIMANPVPVDVVKQTMLEQIARGLEPFIEWECENNVTMGTVVYTGSIYIAKKK